MPVFQQRGGDRAVPNEGPALAIGENFALDEEFIVFDLNACIVEELGAGGDFKNP